MLRTPDEALTAPAKALESSLSPREKVHSDDINTFVSSLPPTRANTAKMGLMDYMGDLYASLTWQEVEAEAPETGMFRLRLRE